MKNEMRSGEHILPVTTLKEHTVTPGQSTATSDAIKVTGLSTCAWAAATSKATTSAMRAVLSNYRAR